MPQLIKDVPLKANSDIKLSVGFGEIADSNYDVVMITLSTPKNFREAGQEEIYSAVLFARTKIENLRPPGTNSVSDPECADPQKMRFGLHFRSAHDFWNRLQESGISEISPDNKAKAYKALGL